MIKFIINADDYGLWEHNSRAIAEAMKKGLITDTTMMATGAWFDEAVALAKEEGFFDRIGIHLNLTEGEPLTEEMKNCPAFVENGRFHKRYNRLHRLSKAEKAAVYAEFSAQVARIRAAGIDITHADSHHHIHTGIFIVPIVLRVCRENGIRKIRLHRNFGVISAKKKIIKKMYNTHLKRRGIKTTDCFGSLYDVGVGIAPHGVTEIMVHPDYDKDGVLIDRVEFKEGIPCGKPLDTAILQGERINYRSI